MGRKTVEKNMHLLTREVNGTQMVTKEWGTEFFDKFFT